MLSRNASGRYSVWGILALLALGLTLSLRPARQPKPAHPEANPHRATGIGGEEG